MTHDTSRRRDLTLDEYFKGVRNRDVTILPRAVTLIESSHPRHQELANALLTRLLPYCGKGIRVGITGAPGVGKSTFIETLGLQLVQQGHCVAVLAIDPSSGVSGGSILGDKTRMAKLAAEPNAYIRPSPSAGTLGGVARKSRETLLLCEAAGYDVVLVETVGVGQSETVVAEMTDCFLALMLPGAGDELQGIKRGLLELVDVIAVNKADGDILPAAQLAAQQYSTALKLLLGRHESAPEVLTCSALHNKHIDTVWAAVQRRHDQLKASGEIDRRHRQQRVSWMWESIEDRLCQAVRGHPRVRAIRADLERDVLSGKIAAESAASRILDAFGAGFSPDSYDSQDSGLVT